MCSPSPTPGPLARLLHKHAVRLNSIPSGAISGRLWQRDNARPRLRFWMWPQILAPDVGPPRLDLLAARSHTRGLLAPVLGQMTAVRMSSPMVRRKPWRVGSMVAEIEVLTDRWDGPAVDHRAVAEICGAANRGLRKCERTHQAECGRQNDRCEFHAALPSCCVKGTRTAEVGCNSNRAPSRPCRALGV